MTLLMRELNCKHLQVVPCGEDDMDNVICLTQVEVPHPLCSHPQMVPCPVSRDEILMRSVQCMVERVKMLNCGHTKDLLCTDNIDDAVCELMVNVTQKCGELSYFFFFNYKLST